jgi:lysophospholipase L1-like esterase
MVLLPACLMFFACGGGGGGGTPAAGPARDLGTRATCFGDSITVGVGASDNQFAYANVIARRNGWTLTNLAQSGTELADQVLPIYSESVAEDANYFILAGFNDMRQFGTDNEALSSYRNGLSAAMAWLAIPEAVKTLATADNVAYTGLWGPSPALAALGKSSAQQGATAVFSIDGSAIYIGTTAEFGGTGAFSVAVDNVVQGTWSAASARLPASGFPYIPFLVRLSGLSAGRHTVVLTVTSAAGNVFFDWAAGLDPLPAVRPFVYLGNTLRMTAAGYTLTINPGMPAKGSDAAVALYNDAARSVCDALSADGLHVLYVDASASYIPAADASTLDEVHPNDQGMAKIAAAFVTVMWR